MSRWFRHYAGMMRDEKLVRAAILSKQPVERVVWVWGAVLESASEVNDNGRFDIDAGEAAYFLRVDECDIQNILSALVSLGRISEGVVARWSDRQFESDKSKDRQKRYRDRHKTSRDGGVTLQEAETETYTEVATAKAAATPRALDLDPTVLEQKLRDAAGEKIHPHAAFIVGPIMELINAGCDLDLDVIPTVRAKAAQLSQPARSWGYFTQAIRDSADRRIAAGKLQSNPNLRPPPQKPKSQFRQHQEDVKNEIDKFLGIKTDDIEPASNSTDIDLEPGNWHAH